MSLVAASPAQGRSDARWLAVRPAALAARPCSTSYVRVLVTHQEPDAFFPSVRVAHLIEAELVKTAEIAFLACSGR